MKLSHPEILVKLFGNSCPEDVNIYKEGKACFYRQEEYVLLGGTSRFYGEDVHILFGGKAGDFYREDVHILYDRKAGDFFYREDVYIL